MIPMTEGNLLEINCSRRFGIEGEAKKKITKPPNRKEINVLKNYFLIKNNLIVTFLTTIRIFNKKSYL